MRTETESPTRPVAPPGPAPADIDIEPQAQAGAVDHRPATRRVPAILAVVAGAVLVGLLALLWFGIGQRDKGGVGVSSVPFRQAPDFQLGLFDGGTFRLSDELTRMPDLHQNQSQGTLQNRLHGSART